MVIGFAWPGRREPEAESAWSSSDSGDIESSDSISNADMSFRKRKRYENEFVPDRTFFRPRTLGGGVSTSGVGCAVLSLELVMRLLDPNFSLIFKRGWDFLGDGIGSSSSSSSS